MIEKQKLQKRYLPRQKSTLHRAKANFLHQQKSLTLRRQASLGTVNNTIENSNHLSNRVKHILSKHNQFGFVRNILSLRLRVHSVVDNEPGFGELDYLNNNLPDNFGFDTDNETVAKIIRKDEFDLGRVLGSGGFGSVYLGSFKGHEVAVKIIHKYTKNPAAQLESFMAELNFLRLNHPNLVQTIAATSPEEFNDGAWVVMEYVGHSSLQGIINDPAESMDPHRRLRFAVQIASALNYIHQNRIAHLDLKPANVLITMADDCKLGDFGCSQRVGFDTEYTNTNSRSALNGTYAYRAPELLRGQPPSFMADIYSYGVTLWQMRARQSPYGDENQHVVIFAVVANGLRPPDPDITDHDPFELSYKDLYSHCWSACPLERPSAEDLVELLTIWKDNM